MKKKWKQIALFIVIPLAVGGLASIISSGAMEQFDKLNKPTLAPPSWLFPIAWTILYILMGIAAYRVYRYDSEGQKRKTALIFYAVQLIFNFVWTILFFNCGAYLLAFIWLIALWVLILITIYLFSGIDTAAAWLMVPYLLWVAFAGYLNYMIWVLN